MAKHGFETAKLTANLDRLLGGWTDSGKLPCVQALVIRHGEEAYSKAFGWADMETKKPLAEDSIFRIYSMTKVFTSVAMLMLLEEGRYKMHDPLSRYIPAFADTKVAEYDAVGRMSLVMPKREIVIRDLFTMASGILYPNGEGTYSEKAMATVSARLEEAFKAGKELTLEYVMTQIADVPLAFHPGEHWWYGYSIDVLGWLVEILSGMPLATFLEERICKPLDLWDTGFYVPEEKQNRFISMYYVDDEGKFTPVPRRQMEDSNYYAPQKFASGGGGLVSTARDVGRFAQMLLGFGKFEGKRLLSRKSVELMRMNHLSDEQLKDYSWDTQRGYGYGLAVRTMMRPEIAGYGTVGEFAWDGMAGTWFSVDPAEELVSVLLVQTVPGRHYEFVPYFAQVVYGAIDD